MPNPFRTPKPSKPIAQCTCAGCKPAEPEAATS